MAIALLKMLAPQLITFLMSLLRPSETGPIGMRISILLNIILLVMVIYVSEVAFAAHRASVSSSAKLDSLEILTADYKEQLKAKEARVRELETLVGPNAARQEVPKTPEPAPLPKAKPAVVPKPTEKPRRKPPDVVVDKLELFFREREKLASDINAG